MSRIKILQSTVLKREPKQSSELNDNEKISVKAGVVFPVKEVVSVKNADNSQNKHIQVFFEKPIKFGQESYNYAFLYTGHIEIVGATPEIPSSIRLNVPFFSQLDNLYNPTGSCNVTSVAMAMAFYGVKARSGQLEDQLYQEMINRGLSRHSPHDLALITNDYGRRHNPSFFSRFKEYATIEEVKAHLAGGNPCITHGYFTSFGHIIVLVGYDESGFIVHDPYGEWFASGYRTDLSGKFLHYSYNLIRRVCIPDGAFWVHFISK